MLANFPRELIAAVGENLDYQQRKERGFCTYPGCAHRPDARPGKESCECEKHHDASISRKRRHAKRKRRSERNELKRRQKNRICLGCGGRRVSGEEHCAGCLVAIGKAKPVADKSVDKSERIAARTSVDADGRSRFHGQGQRGQPKRSVIDEKDLERALVAFKRGKDGLAFAHALEDVSLTKAQRTEAKAEALAQLHQSMGWLEDVLTRHGFWDE